jgi:hypothetical protein
LNIVQIKIIIKRAGYIQTFTGYQFMYFFFFMKEHKNTDRCVYLSPFSSTFWQQFVFSDQIG